MLNEIEEFKAYTTFPDYAIENKRDTGYLGRFTYTMFKKFKGALTEQYVLQQLKATTDFGIYYFTNDRNSCEIDFLLDDGEKVIPLEVKAEENLKAKSLKTYREKFKPALSIRASMANYRKEDDGLVNVPLYMMNTINQSFQIIDFS